MTPPELVAFFKLFHYFGLSPGINQNSSRWQMWAFFIICGVLEVSSVIFINLPLFGSTESRPVETMLSNFFVLADSIKVTAVFIRSLCCHHTFIDIFHGFKRVHRDFIELEHWHIKHKPLRKSYFEKFRFVMAVFALQFGVFISNSTTVDMKNMSSVVFKCWNFITTLLLIHIVFYIDILAFYSKQLNMLIQQDATYDSNNKKKPLAYNLSEKNTWHHHIKHSSSVKSIRHCKIIHFRLWEISQKINVTFGWSITALTMQVFSDSTFCLYWLYVTTQSRQGWMTFICEWNRIFVCMDIARF